MTIPLSFWLNMAISIWLLTVHLLTYHRWIWLPTVYVTTASDITSLGHLDGKLCEGRDFLLLIAPSPSPETEPGRSWVLRE